MAGINFYAPVPRVRSESLPACPRPRDNGESLVRIDGLDARIRYAATGQQASPVRRKAVGYARGSCRCCSRRLAFCRRTIAC